MNYKEHIDNIKSGIIDSAAKALDFLEGDQTRHVETFLDDEYTGLKDWKKRGVFAEFQNITKRIIERSALAYQKQPARNVFVGSEVNKTYSDKYAELLELSDFEEEAERADQICRLLKLAIVLVQYNDYTKTLMFDVLSRANCDVDYDYETRRIKSLLYTADFVGPNGGRVYHYWSDEKIIWVEVMTDGYRPINTYKNPYKIIPAAFYYDMRKPRSSFWPKPAWEELTALNERINIFDIEAGFASRFAMIPPLFTNAEIKNDQVIGPDARVTIDTKPGQDIYLEYKEIKINLAEFVEWLAGKQEAIADNWGVNLKLEGSGGADSGFKLVVEEIWNLETRAKRIKSAKRFERDLYKVIFAISETVGLGLGQGTAYADFEEPELPVNEKENWEIDREKIAVEVMAKEEYWRKENPDITAEEIAAKWKLLSQERAKTPGFENVGGDNE